MQLVLPLLLLAATAVTPSFAFTANSGGQKGSVIAGAFIVQLAAPAKLAKRGVEPAQEATNVLQRIRRARPSTAVRQQLNAIPEAFNGFAVNYDGTAEELLATDGVEKVWPVQYVQTPRTPRASDEPAVMSPLASTSAAQLLNNPDTRNASILRRNSHRRALPSASAYANDTFGPHVQTGIDKLHAAGQIGAGVKIGIIDEGIDYTNPILGGCFGTGCQISFGYDFVGDDYSGVGIPTGDPDPYSSCSDHGTFVAGVIAAIPNSYGFTGAAPGATVGMYRVTSCPGVTPEDVLVRALIQAAQDGCDIISISYGGGVGWLGVTPTQVLVDYLISQGKHVIVATGNDGAEGAFFAEAPASTIHGHSVNAAELQWLPTYQMNVQGSPPIGYISPKPLAVTGLRTIYFTSMDPNVANDACNPLPAGTPDLSTKVVIVKRGTCTFDTKYKNIAAAGGKTVLLYNTLDFMLPQLNPTNGITAVAGLTNDAAMKLLTMVKTTRLNKVSFPTGPLLPAGPNAALGTTDVNKGGLMSSFAGYGPTNELYGQPSYTAPGANIISTVSLVRGGVGIMRGTSFSAPLAAAAAALILSVRKSENLTPLQVRGLLTSTATFIPVAVNAPTYDTVVLQGGGMMNVAKAVAAQTLISPFQLYLNDTKYFSSTQVITITNRSPRSVRYSFNSTAASSIGVYDGPANEEVLPTLNPSPVDAASVGARVTFDKTSLGLNAGATGTVTVTFQAPILTQADIERFPIYSGFVGVIATAGRGASDYYSVPYFGLAASMFDMPVLDTTGVILGPAYPFVAVGQDILEGDGRYTFANGPTIYFRMAAGSRRLMLDLVNADIDFTGTVPSITNPGPPGRLMARSDEGSSSLEKRANPVKYADVPVLGSVYSVGLPARDYRLNFSPTPFSDYERLFDGMYTTPQGQPAKAVVGVSYRVLLRVLKITGNPENQDQYESWLSPSFQFTG